MDDQADVMIDEGSPVSTGDDVSPTEDAELESELRRDGGDGAPKRTAWQEETHRHSLTSEERDAIIKAAFKGATSPLESLLAKLDQWLIQQPEWPVILAAPRGTRRAALAQLAKHFATIPKPGGRRVEQPGRRPESE